MRQIKTEAILRGESEQFNIVKMTMKANFVRKRSLGQNESTDAK